MKQATLLLLLTITLTACNDYDREAPDETVTHLSRPTTYGNDWIYYSLERGCEVQLTEDERLNSLDWDIAFNRYNVRTNSGIRENGAFGSGPGQGGAATTGLTDFQALTKVPADLHFVVDTLWQITAPGIGMPPPTMASTANPVLCQAITFLAPPPMYTVHPDVFIIRTAHGRHAKFQAAAFHSLTGQSGHYAFRHQLLD